MNTVNSNTILNPWFMVPCPNPNAKAHLFFFHHAGGNPLFFYNWTKRLDPSIELILTQLPGHGTHIGKPLLTQMDPIITYLCDAILEYCHKPYYFFGYSLGALIAFELTHALYELKKPIPKCLIVAAKSPPHLSNNNCTYHLPDQEFIEAVKKYNGISAEILSNDSLMNLFLPILRADFKILETYVYANKPPLSCNLVALGGLGDPIVKPQEIEQWKDYTSKNFNYQLFPGDHFFVKTQQLKIIEILFHTISNITND